MGPRLVEQKQIRKEMKIEGSRVYLRRLGEKDATQEYCDWLNDPEVNRYLVTTGATIEESRQYIKEKSESPDCLFLGIFFKENEKHIGNVKLEPIDFKNKKAALGIMLGDKKYWGRGLGTEAMKLLLDWAFDNLGLKEVTTGAVSENKAAIKAYQKAGFQIVGAKKKSIKHGDKVYDQIVMVARK